MAWRNSSFDIEHRFFREGELAVEGWETHVWAGWHPAQRERMRGLPVPEHVRTILSAGRCQDTDGTDWALID